MTSFAIQAGALRENPNSGPDGVGVQADLAYTLEARSEVQAVCGVPSGAAAVAANDNNPRLPLRFLSVCSGIEAASVAWHPLGWRAVAFAEIEKFPSAVLAHHYPDVPILGDFTTINTKTLGRVDILAGGTPCQAFSVAGLRKGLDDARGNLTLKFVELAHELADGNGLRNVVGENVVGVLPDKGNAFGCFLAGLVGADDAVIPSEKPADGKSSQHWKWRKGGRYAVLDDDGEKTEEYEVREPWHALSWPTHGMVSGPKGRAAWAVKDAQFFGVAQRRRRVLVVADFGNGADPAAVLFEPESVCRYSPPSREAGKSVAPDVAPSLVSSGRGVERTGDTRGQDPVVAVLRGHSDYGDGSPTLPAKGGDCAGGSEALVFAPEIARCVATREGSSQDYETTTMVAVAGTLCKDSFSGGMGGRPEGAAAGHVVAIGVTGQTSHALTAEGADASEDGTGRGTPVVCIHADSIGRTGKAVTPSADAAGLVRLRNPGMGIVDDGTSYNLMASGKPHSVLAFSAKEYGADASAELSPTLRAGGHTGSHANGGVMPAVAFQSSQSGVRVGDVHATLDSNNGSRRHNGAIHGSAVRRLTPRECERLQGFPDDYTLIPVRKVSKANQAKAAADTTGAFHEIDGEWWTMSADGPRYKALGNSWAVPKFVWLGKRISALMPSVAANDDQPQSSPDADRRSHA